MKKLGIDARLYSQTGVGTYLRNLLNYLQKNKDRDFNVSAYVLASEHEAIKQQLPEFNVIPVDAHWHTFAEQTAFLKAINNDKPDLMHFTYFSYPLFYSGPFMATIHDVTPLFFKTGQASTKSPIIYEVKHRVFTYLLENQIKKARLVITPTVTVRDQIVSLYGKEFESKIIPVYEGADKGLFEVEEDSSIIQKNNLQNFFLYVGNFYPHKNVQLLVEAFKEVNKEYSLVLTGPDDYFSKSIRELITRLGLQDRVTIVTGSNRAQLKSLYKNALALVHPSLSEGFGLPLIEAVHLDKPIIASDIPVFKELLGKWYVPFNPHDAKSIAEALNNYSQTKFPAYSTELKQRYSFETMASKHRELYSKLLSL